MCMHGVGGRLGQIVGRFTTRAVKPLALAMGI